MTALADSPAHKLGVRRNALVGEYGLYRKLAFLLFFSLEVMFAILLRNIEKINHVSIIYA